MGNVLLFSSGFSCGLDLGKQKFNGSVCVPVEDPGVFYEIPFVIEHLAAWFIQLWFAAVALVRNAAVRQEVSLVPVLEEELAGRQMAATVWMRAKFTVV